MAISGYSNLPTNVTAGSIGHVDHTNSAHRALNTLATTGVTGNGILDIVRLTQAQYTALGTKVATTLYVIVG